MPVCGVDHDQVALRVDQRLGAIEPLVAHRRRRRDAQPAGRVLGRIRIGHRLFDVLHRDQADAAVIVVDDDQLLDPALVQRTARFLLAHPDAYRRQIVARHQLGHRLHRIFGKTHVAVGQDADQLAVLFHHGNAADPVLRHDRLRLRQCRGRRDGDRIDHHPAFEPLHLANGSDLFLDGQVAVQHAHPAQLRHHDRHVGLGHGIHRRRQHRDVERNVARHAGARIRFARQDLRCRGYQKNVVEGEAEPNIHEVPFPCRAGVAAHVTAAATIR